MQRSIHESSKTIILVLGLLSALIVLSKTQVFTSANPASRFATVESLVDRGTFAIDESVFFRTPDKVLVGEHYFSSKPPILSVIIAGGYWIFTQTMDMTFQEDIFSTAVVLNLFFGFLPHLLLLYVFYQLLVEYFQKPLAHIIAFAGISISYLGILYATGISNLTLSALGIVLLFRWSTGLQKKPHTTLWMLSGLVSGLLATIDLPAAIFCIAFFLYYFKLSPSRTLTLFLPAALIPLGVHFAIQYTTTGSFLPVQLRPELYIYPDSHWIDPGGLDSAAEPKIVYLFHMLFGHHGIFIMFPILFIGFLEMVATMFRKSSPLHVASLLLGIPLILTIINYTFNTYNYGGLCVGFRWLIPIMPVLIFFFGYWCEKHIKPTKNDLIFVAVLLSIGAFHIVMSYTPWQSSLWYYLFYYFGWGSF